MSANNVTSAGEALRVRQDGQYWVVELFSAVSKRWLVQGEHLSREAAYADMKSFSYLEDFNYVGSKHHY